jgi:predicted PhzF superfamily epimerase YddE/YHI9
MKLTIYQIDAFAEKPFEGNPAAAIFWFSCQIYAG